MIALIAVIGLIFWFDPIGLEIADNPPAAQTTIGQGGELAPAQPEE